MNVERCTNINFIITVDGDDNIIYSNETEKQLKKFLKYSDVYIGVEDEENIIKIDGDIYTVEDLDSLSDGKEIEITFISSLVDFLSSLSINTISIKGESVSQSEKTLRAIEEEREQWRKEGM